jgi:KaiC/GvpD/RAD55 family RecA-like ATPase
LTPLRDAVQAWLHPRTVTLQGVPQTIPDKGAVLRDAGERIPSSAEEAELRLIFDAQAIPMAEWGALCLLADRIRQRAAEATVEGEADEQIAHGLTVLDYGPERYLRWPWASLDTLVGGMAPGTVHIIACPSKGGKTTLLRSATDLWARAGERIYFAGFEMPAKMLRAMYAADEVGIDPGDVVTGAWLHRHDTEELRIKLREAFQRQSEAGSHYQNIAYFPDPSVTPAAMVKMMRTAADWGAKAVCVDHMDHLAAGGNSYQATIEVCQLLERTAKEYELIVLATSQLNTADKRTDAWRDHRPLRTEHVAFGAKKEQVATTMIGFVRPVKPDMTKVEKTMVEAREKSVYDMLTPRVNQANLMTSRPYASRIGNRALVGWDRGRIVDLPENALKDEQAAQHGIRLGTRY